MIAGRQGRGTGDKVDAEAHADLLTPLTHSALLMRAGQPDGCTGSMILVGERSWVFFFKALLH